jgi:hypothetical protein
MRIYVPMALVPEEQLKHEYHESDFENIDGCRYVVWSRRNTRRDVMDVKFLTGAGTVEKYGSSWFDPILPGLSYSWGEWEVTSRYDPKKMGDLNLLWEAYADNAAIQTGSTLIRDIAVVTTDE